MQRRQKMHVALVDVLCRLAPKYLHPIGQRPQESIASRIVEYAAGAVVCELETALSGASHFAAAPGDMRRLILQHIGEVGPYRHDFNGGAWKHGVFTGIIFGERSHVYRSGQLVETRTINRSSVSAHMYAIAYYRGGYCTRTLSQPLRVYTCDCVEQYFIGGAIVGFAQLYQNGTVQSTYLTRPMAIMADYFDLQNLPLADRIALVSL